MRAGVAFLCVALLAVACGGCGALLRPRPPRLEITAHRHDVEHSLDSNSVVERYTLRGRRLAHHIDYGGYLDDQAPDDEAEEVVTLTDEELRTLAAAVRASGVLAARSVELPGGDAGLETTMEVDVRLDGHWARVRVAGQVAVWGDEEDCDDCDERPRTRTLVGDRSYDAVGEVFFALGSAHSAAAEAQRELALTARLDAGVAGVITVTLSGSLLVVVVNGRRAETSLEDEELAETVRYLRHHQLLVVRDSPPGAGAPTLQLDARVGKQVGRLRFVDGATVGPIYALARALIERLRVRGETLDAPPPAAP